jgi:HEAT repeat protein
MLMPAMATSINSYADEDMPKVEITKSQISSLINDLKSPLAISRIKAAAKLGESGIRSVAPTLISHIKDSNPQVRAEIINTLGKLKIKGFAPKLYRILLHDPSPLVRAKTAIALGRMGYTEARAALYSLLDRPDIRERVAAVRSLGLLGGEKTYRILIRLLNSSNGEIREAVITSLGEMGIKRLAKYILKYVDSNNIRIKQAALLALSKSAPHSIKSKINYLLMKGTPDLKITVLESIARIGCKKCIENIIFLIQKGGDEVAAAAASTAAYQNYTQVSEYILTRLASNPNLSAKIKFIWALARLGRMEIVDQALANLNSPIPELRLVSLKAVRLLRPRSSEIIQKINPLIFDHNESVNSEAYRLLAEYGDRRWINYKIISRIKSPILKSAIAYNVPLVARKDQKLIKLLRRWLGDDEILIKKSSSRALGQIGNNQSTSKLLSFIYHQDLSLKLEAIKALGFIKHPDAKNALKFLMRKDKDSFVKAYSFLSYSLYGMTKDFENEIFYKCFDKKDKKDLREAFIYGLALAESKKPERVNLFKSIFYKFLNSGANQGMKTEFVDLLLIRGSSWAKPWLEIAAKSKLYRVKAQALILLARFREPIKTKIISKPKVKKIKPVKKKEKVKLNLPFSKSEKETGCGCVSNKKLPSEILLFFPLIALLIYRKKFFRK